MSLMRGKYRLRTWLRGHLPGPLSDRFPKGRRDCGNHEWHRVEADTWHCYHCEVGVVHQSPWSPSEEAIVRLAGAAERLRILAMRDGEVDPAQERRIIAEAAAVLDEQVEHARAQLTAAGASP